MIDKYHIVQLETLIMDNARPLPEACDYLKSLKKEGIPYLILTEQTGRNREDLADYLHSAGFPKIPASRIYTSAMAAVDWILSAYPGRLRTDYLGGAAIAEAVQGGGMFLTHDKCDWFMIGLSRSAGYQDYSDIYDMLVHGTNLVSLDSRKGQEKDGRMTLGSGAFAHMLEYASGKEAVACGRGSILFLTQALKYAQVKKSQAVCVGNDFQKDILPALKLGMETVLVTEGNSIMDQGITKDLHPTYIVEDLSGLAR